MRTPKPLISKELEADALAALEALLAVLVKPIPADIFDDQDRKMIADGTFVDWHADLSPAEDEVYQELIDLNAWAVVNPQLRGDFLGNIEKCLGAITAVLLAAKQTRVPFAQVMAVVGIYPGLNVLMSYLYGKDMEDDSMELWQNQLLDACSQASSVFSAFFELEERPSSL